MINLVIDASVGVKWLVPEDYAAEAKMLMDPTTRRIVPSLFFTEVCQTIWKKIRLRRELAEDEGREIIERLFVFPLDIYPIEELHKISFEIALETGRTVYDSVYLALAKVNNCRLVTADQKFYNALGNHPLRASLLWIGEVESLFPPVMKDDGQEWLDEFVIPEMIADVSVEQIELEAGYYTREGLTDEHLARAEGSDVEFLDLAESLITDDGLIHLSRWPNLKNLNLKKTSITDAGLVHLGRCINLEKLNLEGTYVTDNGLKYLHSLIKLSEIELADTDVTEVGFAAIIRALPKMVGGWGDSRPSASPELQ